MFREVLAQADGPSTAKSQQAFMRVSREILPVVFTI